VFVEVARVEEVGSSEVGSSGKVSLSQKVVQVFSPLRQLPSRRLVLGCAITAYVIKACAIKAGVVEVDSRSCCQVGCGFLKQVKGASTSLPFQILFMAIVAGRAVTSCF
jgi:hypothetical protein